MSDKPSIYEALAAVQAGVRAVGKKDRNNEQGYNFRGIDAVVNAVGPVLREHSVIVVPEVLDASYRDVTTSRGKPSREVTVKVRYTFYGPAGDSVSAVTVGEAMDFGDKGTPKAMSVALRVCLLQVLSLPTTEPDADSQSYEREREDWHAEKPPTDAQIAAYEDYAQRIANAQSQQDMDNIAELVRDARGAEKITHAQYNALGHQGKAKRAALPAVTE